MKRTFFRVGESCMECDSVVDRRLLMLHVARVSNHNSAIRRHEL
jgi:hypothetical protein